MKNAAGYLAAAAFAAGWATSAHGASIQPGTLVISEVMANPAAVADTAGEWFELTNTGRLTLNLEGLVIADDGRARHTIDTAVTVCCCFPASSSCWAVRAPRP